MAGYYGTTYPKEICAYDRDDLKDTLGSLINAKESIMNGQSDHMYTYRMWRHQRKESISQLTEIVKELEEYEENCNSVQLVAETVGAISDAVSVIGAALNLCKVTDVKTSGTMIKTGRVASEIGDAFSKGSILVKEMIIKHKASKAKDILKEDAQLTDNLKEFLKPSEEFYRLVNEIMDYEVFINIMDSYRNNHWNTRRSRKSRGKKKYNQLALPSDVETTIEYLPISHVQKQNAKKFMTVVFQSHDVFNMFDQLVDIDRNNPFVSGVLEIFNNMSISDVVHGSQLVLAPKYTNCWSHNMKVSTRKDVLCHGTVSAHRLLENIEKIGNTAEMISNKETSEFTKKLQEVLKMMQNEFDNFEEKYKFIYSSRSARFL